jgi:hypothetical protein
MPYQGEDGKIYSSEQDAQKWGSDSSGGGGGSSGGGGVLGIIILIILAIPALVAKVVGVIFAFLFKLGFVGKIIQTVIISFVGTFALFFAAGVFPYLEHFQFVLDIFGEIAIPVFLMVALWYWLFHYDEIKTISIKEFSNNVTLSFAIAAYGFLFDMFLIAGITQMLFGPSVAGIVGYIVLFGLYITAILVYLKKTKPYREEAAKERTKPKLKKTILVIAAAYMVFSVGSSVLSNVLGLNKKEINIDVSGQSNTEQGTLESESTANKSIWEDPDIAPIDPSLNGIGHYKYAAIRMKAEPHKDAEEIGKIPSGEFFAIKERSGSFFRVDYKGTEGFVQRASVKNLKKDRIAKAIRHTRAYETPNPGANSYHKPKGAGAILLGENVNGFVKVYAEGERWIPAADLKW